jgi:hypothetical protein
LRKQLLILVNLPLILVASTIKRLPRHVHARTTGANALGTFETRLRHDEAIETLKETTITGKLGDGTVTTNFGAEAKTFGSGGRHRKTGDIIKPRSGARL